METKASYLLVGTFVLLAVTALLGFVVWLARGDIRRSYDHYDIFFAGSVSGLGIGGDVRYRGIKVGSILKIAVDPADPLRAGVTIQVDSSVPIRRGDVAALQLQGITGIAYVNISGATADSEPLAAASPDKNPVIPSLPSNFEQLFTDAPEMIGNANLLLIRLADLVNDKNRSQVTAILGNLETLSEGLASRTDKFAALIDNFERTGSDLAEAAVSVRELAQNAQGVIARIDGTIGSVDELVSRDVTPLLRELRDAANAVRGLAETAEAILAENREGLGDFTQGGVGEFIRFLNDARVMVAGLTRLIERIEAQGARILMGQPRPELRKE